MAIILVCKLKGGAGATTTCRELAAAALADGIKVGLIDLDGQGGLTRWWNRRTKATADAGGNDTNPALLQITADKIPAAAAQLRARFGLVIIDSPPSVHETIRAVASAADLALIPARPTVDDLDAVGPIARLLHGVVDFGFVQTQVPGKRSVDGAEALERLAVRAAVFGRTTFRSAYSRPPATGSTGYESDSAPKEEIGELYARLKERLGITSKPE
jgi:chromosome partitioning protein